MSRFMVWVISLALAIVCVSCQRSTSSPLAPNSPAASNGRARDTLPLGLFEVTVDPTSLAASIAPVAWRDASVLGEHYLLDASRYFDEALRVAGVELHEDGAVEVHFALRHPFPLPDASDPQPGDRLDLHLFNVLGIGLFDRPATDTGLHGARVVPNLLRNPAGYTGLLDPSFQQALAIDATVHPYQLFSLDTRTPNFPGDTPTGWSDPYAPQGFNVLPMGAIGRITGFKLLPESGPLRFHLAIQADYQHTANRANRMEPDYALPEGLSKAPVVVRAEVHNNSLMEGMSDGRASVEVEVFDWQAGQPVAGTWSPETTKTALRAESGVASVTLSIPAFAFLETQTRLAAIEGGTTYLDPTVFRFEPIAPLSALPAGDYVGFLEVTDSRTPEPGLDVNGQPVAIEAYRTYQVVTLSVAPFDPAPRPLRLRLIPGARFVPPDQLFSFLFGQFEFSDGSVVPELDVTFHSFDPDKLEVATNGTAHRLTERDASDAVAVRLEASVGNGPFSAVDTVFLGDPYADAVVDYNSACGVGPDFDDPNEALWGPNGDPGGTLEVVSLGYGGSLTLRMTDGGILDKPGVDFIVFENAFHVGGEPEVVFTETMRVEVSENGSDWVAFPMHYTPTGEVPYANPASFADIAGVHPTLANILENSVDPQDPDESGGDAFDLDDVGLEYAEYVRLTSTGLDPTLPCYSTCPVDNRMLDADGTPIEDFGKRTTCNTINGGPDVDAIAIVDGHQGFRE